MYTMCSLMAYINVLRYYVWYTWGTLSTKVSPFIVCLITTTNTLSIWWWIGHHCRTRVRAHNKKMKDAHHYFVCDLHNNCIWCLSGTLYLFVVLQLILLFRTPTIGYTQSHWLALTFNRVMWTWSHNILVLMQSPNCTYIRSSCSVNCLQ